MNVWDLREKEAQAREDLASVQEELRKAEERLQRDPAIALAEVLHSSMCGWNHEDGCSWYYESWDSPGYARGEYLAKARKVMVVLRDSPGESAEDQLMYFQRLLKAMKGR